MKELELIAKIKLSSDEGMSFFDTVVEGKEGYFYVIDESEDLTLIFKEKAIDKNKAQFKIRI